MGSEFVGSLSSDNIVENLLSGDSRIEHISMTFSSSIIVSSKCLIDLTYGGIGNWLVLAYDSCNL